MWTYSRESNIRTVCPDTYPCLEVSLDSLSRHLPLSRGFTRQFVQTPTLVWRFHQTVCPDTYPCLEVSPQTVWWNLQTRVGDWTNCLVKPADKGRCLDKLSGETSRQGVCPDTYPCLEVSLDSVSRHIPLSGGFTRQFVQTPTLVWRFHQTVCPDTYSCLEVSPDSLYKLSGETYRQG
jgi:hypothetical protein